MRYVKHRIIPKLRCCCVTMVSQHDRHRTENICRAWTWRTYSFSMPTFLKLAKTMCKWPPSAKKLMNHATPSWLMLQDHSWMSQQPCNIQDHPEISAEYTKQDFEARENMLRNGRTTMHCFSNHKMHKESEFCCWKYEEKTQYQLCKKL